MTDSDRRAVNIMLGIHLGDALGVPFENMTRQEILSATGGEGVTCPRFDLDPAARKVPDTRGLAPGATSDDTQLAEAVAEGLIMAGRYDHELQVLLHLQALWNDVAGWGGTTKRSLYEIDKWYRSRRPSLALPPLKFRSAKDEKLWKDAAPRDPAFPARRRPKARGNGPSMKIAPFGARYGELGGGDMESGEALEEIFAFSRMTHEDPVCAIAAYAIAGIVCDSICEDPDEALRRLLPRVLAAESHYALQHDGADRFSEALRTALSLVDRPEALWAFGSAGKSDSLTSVPMAIAIWRRHLADAGPGPALLEAINAGGDTDTVAAMVGAMVGAKSDDAAWWPIGWVKSLRDAGGRAISTGRRLSAVSALRRPPDGYDIDEIKTRLGY